MRRGVLLAVLLLTAATAAPAWAAPVVRVTADVRYQGPKVARSFLGFSQEYYIVGAETGYGSAGVNTASVELYRRLAAYGGGPPVYRIGGGSQDATWWNPGGLPRPSSIRHDLNPDFFDNVRRFLDRTGGKVMVGLNFGANDPQNAVAVVDGVRSSLRASQVLSYDIGNEAFLYFERPNGVDAEGRTVFTRPKSYNEAEYQRELARYISALRRVSPLLPLSAGTFSPPGVPQLLRRQGPFLKALALHNYGLQGCQNGKPRKLRPEAILSERIIDGGLKNLFPTVRAARRAGLVPLVTETNSATCGGIPGLGDRFASTLWSVDWMFGLAAIGAEGAYFHNSSPAYQAYSTFYALGRWWAYVKPLYYGMLLFAEATPHGSRLLPSTYYVGEGTIKRAKANVKVWGAVDRQDRVVRVVVIHKGGTRPRVPVDLRVPFARGDGRLKRLVAPGLDADAGIRWGGQTFALPTSTGALVGRERRSRVTRRRDSRFRFTLERNSAVMLTVPVSRTRASRTLQP